MAFYFVSAFAGYLSIKFSTLALSLKTVFMMMSYYIHGWKGDLPLLVWYSSQGRTQLEQPNRILGD